MRKRCSSGASVATVSCGGLFFLENFYFILRAEEVCYCTGGAPGRSGNDESGTWRSHEMRCEMRSSNRAEDDGENEIEELHVQLDVIGYVDVATGCGGGWRHR